MDVSAFETFFISDRWPRSQIVLLFLIQNNSALSPLSVFPRSWCSGLWLKHDIRCSHVWKAAQCTVDDVFGEKWVTQPSESQPVPSSHVEISVQHQAQASTAALENTATLSPQTGQEEAAHANIFCVMTDILFGLNTFNYSHYIFPFIKAINKIICEFASKLLIIGLWR